MRAEERTSNINISPALAQKLFGRGGGSLGATGLMGPPAPPTRDNQQIMTPKFNPMQNAGEFMDPNRMHPQNGGGAPPQMPGQANNGAIQQIMMQLQKLMSGDTDQGLQFQPMELPQFDPDRYKRQAEESVNAQFNPIIQQLLAAQRQTTARANTNRGVVGGLYKSAVGDINQGAKQTQQSYDAAQNESKQLYTDERNRIAAGYAADAAAQRQEAKRLGTESLGDNGAGAQQMADKQFADQMGSQQMQSTQGALGQQEAAAGQYNNAIAQATNAEGVEAQGDIMRQLEDYMAQSNSDLADTRAQQAGGVSDLMMKLASAGYDRDAANTQFQYQQGRDYMGDQASLADRQQEMLLAQLKQLQGGGEGGSEKLNPWQSVATFADQLVPGKGQDLIGAIQGSMSDRGEIYARSKDDDVPMNPALFAKLVADDPNNQDMPRNQLMQVAQELYRLLYGM